MLAHYIRILHIPYLIPSLLRKQLFQYEHICHTINKNNKYILQTNVNTTLQQHYNNYITTTTSQQQHYNNNITTTISQQQYHNNNIIPLQMK